MSLGPTKKQNSRPPMGKGSNQNNKKKRNRNRTQPKRRVNGQSINRAQLAAIRRRRESFSLSPCSQLYLRALLDPYSVEGGKACIPDLNDFPSWKTLVVARGTMNVGSQGVGYVFVNPRAAANTTFNQLFTGASYAGTVATGNIATLGVSNAVINQMPFSAAQVASPNGVAARTVGCGIRVRYTGTELNRSGRLIPFRSDTPSIGFTEGGGVATFLSKQEVPSIACTRQWHSVSYLPASSLGSSAGSSYEYLVATSSDNTTGVDSTGYSLGWFVDGAFPGNGFEYEIYFHKEYVSINGTLVPSGVTASHSDMPGLSAVRNACEGDIPVGDGPSIYSRAYKFIMDYTPTDMSHVTSGIKDVSAAYAAAAPLLGWR